MQQLVSDIVKYTGPTDEVRASNLVLEKEVIKLHREMDVLRRERGIKGSSRFTPANSSGSEGE